MSMNAQSGRNGYRGDVSVPQQQHLVGPTQPNEQEKKPPVLIECAADRHIAVEFSDIFKELTKTLQNVSDVNLDDYKALAELIENLYAQKFMAWRRSLKSNFLMFSVGAKDQVLPAKVGKSLPNKPELDEKELKLVYDILQLMAAARFHLMTEKDWDLSLNEDFKFYLPVEINFSFFEQNLLSRFWASDAERTEMRRVLSDVSDKMLVFHRGIGVAEDTGMFFQEKLDLLVEYCVVEPVKAAWEQYRTYLPAMFQKEQVSYKRSNANSWARSPSKGSAAAPNQHANDLTEAGSPRAAPHTPEANQRRGMNSDDEEQAPKKKEEPHRKRNTIVERRSLRILMPSASQVFAKAFKQIKLQEPMFKEVVVVYRTSPQGRAAAKPTNRPGFGKDNTTRLRHILNRRNVHIKYFHDIPMADIEAIFPDKIVYSKNISRISMIVQAVIAFVAAIATMWQAGALSLQTLWSVLTLVSVRAGQMYSRMQFERSRVMQEMVNILYDKMLDAQEGVLSMLLEDMAEQQLKEAVIAYMLLLSAQTSMTEEDLDIRCENFLEHTYANNCKIDFAVEDTLPQLVEWGLVKDGIRRGIQRAHSNAFSEDRYSHISEKTVVSTDSTRAPPHKQSRGPAHKIKKTFKNIFQNDGTTAKAHSRGTPRASESGALPTVPSSARTSMNGAPSLAAASTASAKPRPSESGALPAGPVAPSAAPKMPAPPVPQRPRELAREREVTVS
ncbi:hypothetical protein DUNSADRAFT_10338 [Dunaliella salina]|uniref:SMODS and SLOG-associating 2TM effector domain-containing protein n=1 Tax=Dunaliella salina TaxID=3046 RepID=A0ABQ7H4W8_DUNSA|nr:hypothetical protein DUNSADRAFT_10338 [Dunaliella salina]|eukprot:KAF5841901.1 hypothetical protein DUNSADRAFT_10338 [Dunaliella salina]